MRMRNAMFGCLMLLGCRLDSGKGGNHAGSSGESGSGGGGAACGLPFDSGPCEAAFPVWAFVPALGACFPHTYGGCEGNDNRFDTREACESACPITGACPSNRIERDICLQCGLGGGCAETGTACALICSDSSQCEGTTAHSVGCFDGVCQVTGCI